VIRCLWTRENPPALQHEQHGFTGRLPRWIFDESGDELQIEQGTLCPALHRLEEQGWIDAEWGLGDKKRRAKLAALTPADLLPFLQSPNPPFRLAGRSNPSFTHCPRPYLLCSASPLSQSPSS
jgi:hypothetical protein